MLEMVPYSLVGGSEHYCHGDGSGGAHLHTKLIIFVYTQHYLLV